MIKQFYRQFAVITVLGQGKKKTDPASLVSGTGAENVDDRERKCDAFKLTTRQEKQ